MTEIGIPKSELDTPSLWVDLDILEQNITTLSNHFKQAGVAWRPHTKGIKVPAIAHKVMAAGGLGMTCAKLGEAEVMVRAGIQDILIANQIVGATKINRLAAIQHHADVKVAVDDETNVAQLGQIASQKGVEIGVVVDVNTGMNRTGVAPGEEAVKLSQLVHQTAGLRYRGLMAWEGHAASMQDFEAKEVEIKKAVGLLADTVKQCRAVDLPVEIVSGGGSGTYTVTAHLDEITEVQAGGAMLGDMSYVSWGAETKPSIFVRSMVVSTPSPKRVIFDAGFKALPVWNNRMVKPIGVSDFKSYGTSAEHGTMVLEEPNTTLKVGDAVDFIVGYTDMTVFLYDVMYGVRDGVVETMWPIEGRGKVR